MSLADQFPEITTLDAPLAPFTHLKIGGPAEFLVQPRTVDELNRVLTACQQTGIKVRMLGGGYNLLIKDDPVSGAVIRLVAEPFTFLKRDGKRVTAGGGGQLFDLIAFAVKHGLGGRNGRREDAGRRRSEGTRQRGPRGSVEGQGRRARGPQRRTRRREEGPGRHRRGPEGLDRQARGAGENARRRDGRGDRESAEGGGFDADGKARNGRGPAGVGGIDGDQRRGRPGEGRSGRRERRNRFGQGCGRATQGRDRTAGTTGTHPGAAEEVTFFSRGL